MNKLFACLIVLSFLFVGAASSFANQPSSAERHAVWSNWSDEKGERIHDKWNTMDSERKGPQPVPTRTVDKGEMEGKAPSFDFINETKTYDHSKDRTQTPKS